MRRVFSILTGGGIVTAFLDSARPAAAQCAMCRTGLMNSPEGRELIAGFNSGILLLLTVPLLIFVGVVWMLRRAARNRTAAAQHAGPSVSAERRALSSSQLS